MQDIYYLLVDTEDLGSSSKQWRDIYTGDINLNNTKTSRVNEIDGTRYLGQFKNSR